MMKRKAVLFSITLLCVSPVLNAQKLSKENSIDISKQANRGYLGNVVTDDTKKQIDMVFVTKSSPRHVKFQVYQFDYDLNLINSFEDEQEVEKASAKYKWFNFRGEEEYTVKGIAAEADMMGRATFTSREITYKYNWFNGKYKKSVKVLKKLKPATDNNKKMLFRGAYSIDETGEVLALAAEKAKATQMYVSYTQYQVLKVNSNVEITSREPIAFEKAQYPVWTGGIHDHALAEDEEESGDWAIIFAPYKIGGMKGYIADDPTAYTYVRVGRDGKVKETIPFHAKGYFWKVDGAYELNGTVYVYGLCKKKNLEKSYADFSVMQLPTTEKGFEGFQLCAFSEGKSTFVSAPDLDEFATKNGKPSEQKKPIVYKGGRLNISGINVTTSGDVIINAQEYSYDAAGSYRGNRYKDFIVFWFNKDGELIRQYGIDNSQKTGIKGATDPRTDPKYYPTRANVFESADGKNIYWMAYLIGKVEKHIQTTTLYEYTWYTPRIQARLGKINLQDGSISNFVMLGGEDTYLFEDHPTVTINNGAQVILLGENPKAKTIWLGKFDPSQM